MLLVKVYDESSYGVTIIITCLHFTSLGRYLRVRSSIELSELVLVFISSNDGLFGTVLYNIIMLSYVIIKVTMSNILK